MKKIRIVFNCKGSNAIGSVRIPFFGIKNCFDHYEGFDVAREVYGEYSQFDVAILHGDENEIIEARKQNPNIFIGVAKPHHERVVHPPFHGLGAKSFLYQYRFIFGDEKSRFIKGRNEKLEAADFLIADTMYLKGLFESKGFNSVYLKLIEPFWEDVGPIQKKGPEDKTLIFGYHGNYRHFIESKGYIFPALSDLSRDFDVKLKVITNLSFISEKDKKSQGFEIEYFEYSFPEIFQNLSDIDIGLVPNQIQYKNAFYKLLFERFGAFFWKTDKYHDVLLRFKQSANAGRAYVFAQLGKPFVACPVPEVVSVFGEMLGEYYPLDAATWKNAIKNLALNEQQRITISAELIRLTANSIDLKIESEKLKDYILARFKQCCHQ